MEMVLQYSAGGLNLFADPSPTFYQLYHHQHQNDGKKDDPDADAHSGDCYHKWLHFRGSHIAVVSLLSQSNSSSHAESGDGDCPGGAQTP